TGLYRTGMITDKHVQHLSGADALKQLTPIPLTPAFVGYWRQGRPARDPESQMWQLSRLIEVEHHMETGRRTESDGGFVVLESLEHCLGSEAIKQHGGSAETKRKYQEPT